MMRRSSSPYAYASRPLRMSGSLTISSRGTPTGQGAGGRVCQGMRPGDRSGGSSKQRVGLYTWMRLICDFRQTRHVLYIPALILCPHPMPSSYALVRCLLCPDMLCPALCTLMLPCPAPPPYTHTHAPARL